MSLDRFPVGLEMDVSYPEFQVSLTLLSTTRLKFEIKEGPFARTEIVDIQVIPLGNSIFAVSWQEMDGATVTNVQDYDRGLIHSHATLPTGEFLRMTGTLVVTRPANHAFDDRPLRNKALVLEAMTSLFQRHDASAVERLYTPDYIQHNPNIPQGRDSLQTLVAALSKDVYYEPGLMIAEGDFVAIHGRIRGSRFVMVPHARHGIFWEQPEFTNETIHGFLRDVMSPQPTPRSPGSRKWPGNAGPT